MRDSFPNQRCVLCIIPFSSAPFQTNTKFKKLYSLICLCDLFKSSLFKKKKKKEIFAEILEKLNYIKIIKLPGIKNISFFKSNNRCFIIAIFKFWWIFLHNLTIITKKYKFYKLQKCHKQVISDCCIQDSEF